MAREIVAPLTADEKADLASLELIVDQGLDAFLAVGQALAEIQERRLWRPAKSFQAYIAARYPEMCRSRAYQAIRHAKVYENLSTTVDTAQLNERHTRALAGFGPHLHAEIVTRAKQLASERGGKGDLTEPLINRAGLQVLDEKNRRPTIGETDEMEIDRDEDGDDVRDSEPPPSAPEDAALAGAAERTAPPRVHPLLRAMDHHRLGRKDSRKTVAEDMEDAAIRERAVQLAEDLEAEAKWLRELLTTAAEA